ncbi:HU family DNA-binding protein [Sagittula sp. NFXS13]|uniref:HU family DNA-binding protein n=1 Tax=Sagittula sp. NFXS13 TaxID=2819095 RepID=UPI0032DEAA0B
MTSTSKPTSRWSKTREFSTSTRGIATIIERVEPPLITIGTDENVLHADSETWGVSRETKQPQIVQVSALPLVPQPEVKKKELVEAAVARSGVKKRDAKLAIEAALAVLGKALAEGRDLNLLPLGKLKVTGMKRNGNGHIINARVRQPEESGISVQDPLAQAAE